MEKEFQPVAVKQNSSWPELATSTCSFSKKFQSAQTQGWTRHAGVET